ncbi:MAG: UDP-glucose--hexose-1-phosphate uridylyltransferase [Fimbriimonadaceae bacterium]|nr:UDP-glucose--hexose-1-phosphate uridylyltransferase [Fimbriimonadaceae bacterium]
MDADLAHLPHRRWNPLLREWVLVSPHRAKRPWLGAEETVAESRPAYDPDCYLCPGNQRVNGDWNPDYKDTYVFHNDFSALLPEPSHHRFEEGLMRAEPAAGECRVVCFSPRHDQTLADMEAESIVRVIETWQSELADLGQRWDWVQVFENKGEVMGCSNPHPHGQIWASDFIPSLPARELEAQADHFHAHRRPLLMDSLAQELASGERIVDQNEHWVWLVPFWAVWPFETMLLPRRPIASLLDVAPAEVESLAEIMKAGLRRYDALFGVSFPYSMGWHGAPTRTPAPGWQLHAHWFPPLLRSATVKKFMVGYEMLAESQRDLTPEQAAERLRSTGG